RRHGGHHLPYSGSGCKHLAHWPSIGSNEGHKCGWTRAGSQITALPGPRKNMPDGILPPIMKHDSTRTQQPVLIIPYVWIGDFVRCHSIVKLLRTEVPNRPVDIVTSTLCAPLADYMPGIRETIVADLPRGRLGLARQFELARKLREGRY